MRETVATLAVCLAVSVPAAAQSECAVAPLLQDAQQALEEADFEGADQLLDRVSQCPLELSELRSMLELQVLVSFADERLGALERNLRALVSLDPEAGASPLFPSAVTDRFEEIRAETPEVDAEVELVSDYAEGELSVGLVAQRRHDPGNLVRRVDVYARLSGAGEYRLLGPGERLRIEEPHEPATIDAHLVLFGPGEARLATRGSPSEPLRMQVDPMPMNRRPLRIGLTIGGLLLAVGAAVFVVAAVRTDGFRGEETTVSPATRSLLSF